MKLGWVHVLVWLVLTAAITFILVTFGDLGSQIALQFGIHLPAHLNTQMIIALALISAFQAAVMTAAGTIILFVFGQFRNFGKL
ncbi:MAG: hypothetical protein ABA06_01270 [Parcubacteria bacterium C7867-001]|nr:MAG: hypothetical protein ABA06_01270 [Parcubacteria bacterium C7867-001]